MKQCAIIGLSYFGKNVLDVLNEESLRRALPSTVDAVVIDLGDKIEASILGRASAASIGFSAATKSER
jgi:Trk K+ transport system NAD-binding subunit